MDTDDTLDEHVRKLGILRMLCDRKQEKQIKNQS